jgi:hypothetical protein
MKESYMAEDKALASKDLDDLTEREAQRLAESRATASLEDYDPSELKDSEKVVEWRGQSFESEDELLEKQGRDKEKREAKADSERREDKHQSVSRTTEDTKPTPRTKAGDRKPVEAAPSTNE